MLDGLKSLDHNEWRDAARAALQGAVAAIATFLMMRQLGLPEALVGILSAIFILQPSIGGTAKSAASRLMATLVGTLAGLTTLLALPYDVGTALALALSVFLVCGMSSFRPDWTYGIVAAVGISLASEQDPMQTAVDRAIAIALGAALGALASLVVWPERSRSRREKHFRRAVRAVRDRVNDAVATAAGEGEGRASEIAPRYYREMALAREADAYSRLRSSGGNDRLAALRRLYNATIIVDRADEALADHRRLRHDLKGPVGEIRTGLVEALDRILEGETPPETLLLRIDRAVSGLADPSIAPQKGTDALRARHALTFGLAELRASLGQLVETLVEAGR